VAPDPEDAHPDHVEASRLVERACYLAGLARFGADLRGGEQDPGGRRQRHRPERLLFALYRERSAARTSCGRERRVERRMRPCAGAQSQLESGARARDLPHGARVPRGDRARGRSLGRADRRAIR